MVQFSYSLIFDCISSIGLCVLLSTIYVGSLHIWNVPHDRNHPRTIKVRFLSVFAMLFVSAGFLYYGIGREVGERVAFTELLGFRSEGLVQAIILPLLLTMVLFLGPLATILTGPEVKQLKEANFWFGNFQNLIWLRNYVIAPLSEEFTYRSCMLPLLLQCFPSTVAVIICPLFFGVAHFHHLQERVRMGMDYKAALQLSCFQLGYTTLFGIYSAFLLMRTGHFASTFVVHSFCNAMGFPDIAEIFTYQKTKKNAIIGLYIAGFVVWCLLVNPLTQSYLYNNNFSWYSTNS